MFHDESGLKLCVFGLAGTESFGIFSCTIDGEEKDQTHRAVYRSESLAIMSRRNSNGFLLHGKINIPKFKCSLFGLCLQRQMS